MSSSFELNFSFSSDKLTAWWQLSYDLWHSRLCVSVDNTLSSRQESLHKDNEVETAESESLLILGDEAKSHAKKRLANGWVYEEQKQSNHVASQPAQPLTQQPMKEVSFSVQVWEFVPSQSQSNGCLCSQILAWQFNHGKGTIDCCQSCQSRLFNETHEFPCTRLNLKFSFVKSAGNCEWILESCYKVHKTLWKTLRTSASTKKW